MAASLVELRKAAESLKEALATPYSDLVRDAAIQRFEFCIELAWKVLKKVMGTTSVAPKAIVREAAQQGLIEDPKAWIRYIDARNKTSHTYNESVAKEVFDTLQVFMPDLETLLTRIEAF